jgi:hypothetical protein
VRDSDTSLGAPICCDALENTRAIHLPKCPSAYGRDRSPSIDRFPQAGAARLTTSAHGVSLRLAMRCTIVLHN